MSIAKMLEQSIKYIPDAVVEIFSPNLDDYPEIRIQPFKGSFKKKNQA